jgi:hypothetical protein
MGMKELGNGCDVEYGWDFDGGPTAVVKACTSGLWYGRWNDEDTGAECRRE